MIPLRNGLVLPLEVIRLGCAIEDAGYRWEVLADGVLQVKKLPGHRPLLPAQRDAIGRWKHHLAAAISTAPDPKY